MIFKCPGSKYFREPHPQFLKCSNCGSEIEIWTDEIKTTCSFCGKEMMRGELPGCLNWCKYAKECAEQEIYNKYLKNKKKNEINN